MMKKHKDVVTNSVSRETENKTAFEKKTKKSLIIKMLRKLFFFSVERREAYRRYGKKCYICGATEKLHCHHIRKVNWEKILKVIYEELLTSVENYKIVCRKCHNKIHKNIKEEKT